MRFLCLMLLVLPAWVMAADKEPYESITDKHIAEIEYDDVEIDNGFRTPLAKDLTHLDDDRRKQVEEWADKLEDWIPGQEKLIGQRVYNYMCLACFGDVGRGEFEAEYPYVIFERVKKQVPKEQLKKILASISLNPKAYTPVTKAPDLGFEQALDEQQVRERAEIYARKLLGRLVGKLPPKEQ